MVPTETSVRNLNVLQIDKLLQNIIGLLYCIKKVFFCQYKEKQDSSYAQKNLACHVRRAQASLDCYIMQHKHLPVNVRFFLKNDTLIKRILLYGTEIYGFSTSNDMEQLHVNFIKKNIR